MQILSCTTVKILPLCIATKVWTMDVQHCGTDFYNLSYGTLLAESRRRLFSMNLPLHKVEIDTLGLVKCSAYEFLSPLCFIPLQKFISKCNLQSFWQAIFIFFKSWLLLMPLSSFSTEMLCSYRNNTLDFKKKSNPSYFSTTTKFKADQPIYSGSSNLMKDTNLCRCFSSIIFKVKNPQRWVGVCERHRRTEVKVFHISTFL